MTINKLLIAFLTIITISSCKNNLGSKLSDTEIWKLGWRMIENSWDENYEIASSQFDSLLNTEVEIEKKYLATGLEVKHKLGKDSEIEKILTYQNQESLREFCSEQFLQNREVCKGISDEHIENKELQMELIRMYVDDQSSRGNIMEDIVSKYKLDESQITQYGAKFVDKGNRIRLKEIFENYGFPTKKLVGKDAMNGIFLMIQHSDGDKEWQESQLPNIKSLC